LLCSEKLAATTRLVLFVIATLSCARLSYDSQKQQTMNKSALLRGILRGFDGGHTGA
jgi:hypothetical protein